MRRSLIPAAATLWLCAVHAGESTASALMPRPFTATYAVSYRGIDAGTLRMQLRREPDGGYSYETRAKPSFLASFAISSNAIERSEMEVTEHGVRPLTWQFDDGRSGNQGKGDGSMQFNWTSNLLNGLFEGHAVALPLKPGVQDRQSAQIQVMSSLMRGEEPGTMPMLNDDRIREYVYTRGETTSVDTKLGRLQSVLYESTRPGSSRLSRVWYAPSLEYLPVRAEQIRKGKVETVMTLVALEREGG